MKEMHLNMAHMLRSRSRLVALFLLFVTCAVLLSGCFHINNDVKLNGDGSGSYTLTLGLSEAFVGLAGDQLVTSMDETGQKVKQEGGDYRHFDQDGYSVWVFTRPFKSVRELNTLLQRDPVSSATNPGGGASAPSPTPENLAVSETPGFFVNTFHVTGHISLKDLNTTSSDGSGIDVSSYLQDARASVSITMPGWITSYEKGGEVHGNTVTFTAHYNEEATIDVVGGGVNPIVFYIAGGTGLLVLLAIGGVIFWRRRLQHLSTNEPALVPAPPQYSTAGYDQEGNFDRDYASHGYDIPIQSSPAHPSSPYPQRMPPASQQQRTAKMKILSAGLAWWLVLMVIIAGGCAVLTNLEPFRSAFTAPVTGQRFLPESTTARIDQPTATPAAGTIVLPSRHPHVGGQLADFIAAYGQPFGHGIGGSDNFYADNARSIILSVGFVNTVVSQVAVIGHTSWSEQQTFDFCATFLPDDATKYNSAGRNTDYSSSSGQIVLATYGQGTCMVSVSTS